MVSSRSVLHGPRASARATKVNGTGSDRAISTPAATRSTAWSKS
jgi:hypothetical protein